MLKVRVCDCGYKADLLSEEKLVNCTHEPLKLPSKPANIIKYLCGLARVKEYKDIGSNGPLYASGAMAGMEDAASQQLFKCAFGRDSIISAQAMKHALPQLIEATLAYWATLQGTREDTYSEEEPGRIPHEVRDPEDPIAQKLTLENKWQWPFYASIDATVHFAISFCEYAMRTGQLDTSFINMEYTDKNGQKQQMIHALNMAVQWMLRRMDTNPEFFIESKRKFPTSHSIQSMEDSWDSHFHANGDIADPDSGVTSVEVQGYLWQALGLAGNLYHQTGRDQNGVGVLCLTKAEELRESVMRNLWVTDEQGGYFAAGGDRDQLNRFRPFRIRKASMGELLTTGILDSEPEKVAKLVSILMSPTMLCASGIRSCDSREVRFRPGSYHSGNSWVFKTFLIAQGMERHGFLAEALDLYRRIIKVVAVTHIYPEYTRGGFEDEPMLNEHTVDVYDSRNQKQNRIEQPPQLIQAWTVAALVNILHRAASDLEYAKSIGVGSEFVKALGLHPLLVAERRI